MKPTNVPIPPWHSFWCLKDGRGSFYAYSDSRAGVRCADDTKFARKYSSRKGAWAAQENIKRAYGKHCDPVKFEVVNSVKAVD